MGSHPVPRTSLAEARKWADDSFCTSCSAGFMSGVPTWEQREADNAILLKAKNVEPHNDPWVGRTEEPLTADRRSIFWFLKGSLIIQVANDYTSMSAGDFIVFNDSLVHSVQSKVTWLGAAWQLRLLPSKMSDSTGPVMV